MKVTNHAYCLILLASVALPSVADPGRDRDDGAALRQEVAELQQQVATLTRMVNRISSNSVLALDGKLALGLDRQTALFTGVNIQITNGTGGTQTINGVGNLIIGYDEPNGTINIAGNSYSALNACSNGQFANQTACQSAGSTWGSNQHTGSHNLVIGFGQSYTSYGGMVTGALNVINGEFANVSGGINNTASGPLSSTSGGDFNTANGNFSSVSGGDFNIASGNFSSVSGGHANRASNDDSSVSGGGENTASGQWSSVTGGTTNYAAGPYSSVNGGRLNTAGGYVIGYGSTVSGGSSETQINDWGWTGGTYTSP